MKAINPSPPIAKPCVDLCGRRASQPDQSRAKSQLERRMPPRPPRDLAMFNLAIDSKLCG
jgi:hypothetical protein